MRRTISAALLCALFLGFPACAALADRPETKPVKVFILAGQSNMVGDGHVTPPETPGTLAYMVKTSDRTEQFKHLVGPDGTWRARKDVWYFQRQPVKKGPQGETVDVACDLRPGLQGGTNKPRIGPELQFGHVMGDHFDEQVLIVKAAWGGKSLAVDFRPPSAGSPTFAIKAAKDGTRPEIGKYYRAMIADLRYCLDQLDQLFPSYQGQGYEIVGLGWHQGWNDGCNADHAAEYETNLGLFIQDLRQDLEIKDLPVVIASSGFGGHDNKLPGVRRRIKDVVEPAQIKAAAGMKNVTCVKTRDFFRPREQSPTGASYHWNSNAETYFLIGDAMAKAMKALCLPPARTSETLRVLSYNIHMWEPSVEALTTVIRAASPDIVGLNEAWNETHNRELAQALGYHMVCGGQGIPGTSEPQAHWINDYYMPQVLLTKHKIVKTRFFNAMAAKEDPAKPDVDPQVPVYRGATLAVLETDRGTHVAVFVLHLHPWGGADNDRMTTMRLAEIKGIMSQIKPYTDLPVLIIGDYNTQSHLDGIQGFKVTRYLEAQGYQDLYRTVHPDPKTSPGRTSQRSRIDYIFYNQHVTPVDCQVLEDGVFGSRDFDHSDHLAVFGEVKITQESLRSGY
jgi:endonuclease/exonuclease/phosphatase family metal-dependent hydrolase